jgi:hypothetical protein
MFVFIAVVPLLLFSLFRWSVVGHLGLVSFGGINVSAITTQMLTRDLITELSSDVQPLARHILDRLDQHEKIGLHPVCYRSNWRPLSRYDAFEICYSYIAWDINYRAAMTLYDRDFVKANTGLTSLAKTIILAKPMEYIVLLSKSIVTGISRIVRGEPIALILGGLLLFTKFIQLCTRNSKTLDSLSIEYSFCFNRELSAMIFLAVSFFMAALLLVILVEPPIQRYVNGASVFIPSVLALGIFSVVVDIRRIFQQR